MSVLLKLSNITNFKTNTINRALSSLSFYGVDIRYDYMGETISSASGSRFADGVRNHIPTAAHMFDRGMPPAQMNMIDDNTRKIQFPSLNKTIYTKVDNLNMYLYLEGFPQFKIDSPDKWIKDLVDAAGANNVSILDLKNSTNQGIADNMRRAQYR